VVAGGGGPRVGDVVELQELLGLPPPGLGEGEALLLLVHLEVLPRLEQLGEPGEVAVLAGRVRGGPGDDERRPCLVDQDVVDLVHDRVVEGPLHHLGAADDHVVAEVVEPELGVRPVEDVAGVGCPPLIGGRRLLEEAHREAQELVHRPHPRPVAAGEVVVHRHDVDPPHEGVEVGGHGRDEGLPFPRLHLRDPPLVEDDRPHHLNVERAEPDRAGGRLAHRGERLGEEIIGGLPRGEAGAELVSLRAEVSVGQGPGPVRPRVHLIHAREEFAQALFVRLSEQEVNPIPKGRHKRLYDSPRGAATDRGGPVTPWVLPPHLRLPSPAGGEAGEGGVAPGRALEPEGESHRRQREDDPCHPEHERRLRLLRCLGPRSLGDLRDLDLQRLDLAVQRRLQRGDARREGRNLRGQVHPRPRALEVLDRPRQPLCRVVAEEGRIPGELAARPDDDDPPLNEVLHRRVGGMGRGHIHEHPADACVSEARGHRPQREGHHSD